MSVTETESENGIESLQKVPAIGISTVESLRFSGYNTMQDLQDASIEDLIEVPNISQSRAKYIIQYSQQ